MDPKELQQLKASIQKARRQPVNFAYSPNKNPKEDDALLLHPRKKPKMLLLAVKKVTKNPKSMCGEVSIKSKDMTLQCIGKPPTQGLIKMMRKFLISQKLTFKIHVLDEDGETIHSDHHETEEHESEDIILNASTQEDDELTSAGATDTFEEEELQTRSTEDITEAQEEKTTAQETSDAAAKKDNQDQALREKLTAILSATAKRVGKALGDDEALDSSLKQKLEELKNSVNKLDEKATQAGVKDILELLAHHPGARKVDQKEVAVAVKELQLQRKNVETNLGSLLSSLKSHPDPRMRLIAAKGPSQALMGDASVLKGHLDVVMGDLKAWGGAPANKRDAVAKKLSSSIATLNTHMNSDNLISLLEKNPLGVSVSIKKPIADALKGLEEKIAT
ncbi:hypothetical protein PsAD2_03892 [Pseudovibrio axinellae]|uniref:Uncharacterized protein n=2 Tax=Pseudovibrio axinellae TaxID=989403 RepID=A0A165UN12_9HYPH|nr:hypothetical protein PsAD2_03892 [Pseudovibrio axinellae]SEP65640.1 hypothetical protein SAMN05421798_10188 [Pseudovibrio axinellae]